MPNDQNLQNCLNNLMRVSGHLDPKVADAGDHLSHKTPSLHDHRHQQEVEMGVVQAIPKVVHRTGLKWSKALRPTSKSNGYINSPCKESAPISLYIKLHFYHGSPR